MLRIRFVAWTWIAWLAISSASIAACSGSGKRRAATTGTDGGAPVARKSGDVTLFFTTELMGSLEPCGCTSDPMGYIERTAALIAAARSERPVALLDGGSTLYPEPPIAAEKQAQEDLEAELLAKLLTDELRLGGAALGPTDLARGKDGVRFPRHAANVAASSGIPIEAPRVLDLDGVRIGVFGVVDPQTLAGTGVDATPAADAARLAIAKLRADGAQLVVALAHMDRAKARKLAREAPGAEIVLVGADAPELGLVAPEPAGASWLITPGTKGQVIARLDLRVEAAGGSLVDAVGPERATIEIAKLDEKIAKLRSDLERWERDPSADPAFVKTNREELSRMQNERDALHANPLRKPPAGQSWFTLRHIAVKKSLPCAPDVVKQKQELDRRIGEKNLELAKDELPPPVPEGKAGYVGADECVYCHKAAVDFWKTTKHWNAWETLEVANKHLNRDCVGCHVTGYGEPGGATLVKNELLRDVQCETCHGPASLHVDADGKEQPKSLMLAPPEDLCATKCHTPEHSDTFEHTAYMRDVVGKGHGEKLRKKLGDGPTGLELRSAALEKAGRALGAGCPK